ncbi:MAG: DUF169 domain-containing protein [Acidobacteriota bacterium]|nr:DUF169 domain-containing protein [Acidobacteriota bacterium]
MSSSRPVQETLGLRTPPIAIGFLDDEPEGLARWHGGSVPAGCAFWTKAMAGETFYTVPSDHFNCPVGCHTHRLPLPASRRTELGRAADTMIGAGYLLPSDVMSMPSLSRSPAAVAYGPVDAAPFPWDVILLAATPAQGMLIYEAFVRLGDDPLMVVSALGRPACSLLPFVTEGDRAALSFGCAGNRTFTDLPDDQLYFAVPAALWDRFSDVLETIVRANETMATYYEGKKDTT